MSRQITFPDLVDILARRGAASRHITAIAGPPGAGKSTLAECLVASLNERDPDSAAVLPMDGFHFDDTILDERGRRTRKGAPDTFDVGGLSAMLARLRANVETEIAVPVFDRETEIARAGARLIARSVRNIVVEGNYLLLGTAPWDVLHPFYDTTVMIEVTEAELRRRLEIRWQGLPAATRVVKLDGNDLPNGRLVKTHSVTAEFFVRSTAENALA
ncbi:MAG: nucleoside/nucleotide kinase family protein [Hyphomicrobiales bacterium]|nr:MAG: nucleoside/nucleotide kinase family protein [Hyphomicrobiales bacterium]